MRKVSAATGPGAVWLHFNFSLVASRRSTLDAEPGGHPDLPHKPL